MLNGVYSAKRAVNRALHAFDSHAPKTVMYHDCGSDVMVARVCKRLSPEGILRHIMQFLSVFRSVGVNQKYN